MTRWHDLEPVDSSFFTTAPVLHRYPVRLAAPPERVWESLASDRSVADWYLGIKALTWTSPRPFGIDTTRDLDMPLSSFRVRERFFRWDEGRGYSFYVTQSNRSWFSRFAEDYQVEADGTGTLFTFTIGIEPTGAWRRPMTTGAPVVRASFGQVARGARRYFAKHP